MRESYVPLFESLMTSSLWALPGDVIKCWLALILRADPEGYWCGTAPGLALEAHVPLETARRSLELFEAPDPDSRDTEHEGRRVQRVPRGWFVFGIEKFRKRASVEAEKARKRRWAQEHRGRGDYGTPAAAPTVEEAKQEVMPVRDLPDRAPRRVALRSEPVDAPKKEEIDAVERELLGVPPLPPQNSNKREAEEEGPRFYDLEGFEPSAGLVAWFERYGLPPMALHERLRKVRLAKVAIGGKNGVDDREEWCRLQAPRWKKWWQDDGGRAEPLPVQRRAPARPAARPSSPVPVGVAMPEALLQFVATGQLPPPPKAGAEVAA